MQHPKRCTTAVVGVLIGLFGASAAYTSPSGVTRTTLDRIVSSWPAHPREGVMKIVAKYGLPNEATPSRVTWFNNGPWKRTIVYRDEIPHDFPKPHTDFVEQFITRDFHETGATRAS